MKAAGLLHAALWANATFTTACALTLLAAPAAAGAWVGLDGIAAQVALGAGLLLFVAGLSEAVHVLVHGVRDGAHDVGP